MGMFWKLISAWLRKFSSGDFNLSDIGRGRWPIEFDNDALKVLIERDLKLTKNSNHSSGYLGISTKTSLWNQKSLPIEYMDYASIIGDEYLKCVNENEVVRF